MSESLLDNQADLHKFAEYLVRCHGASAFQIALAQAKNLSTERKFQLATIWDQIALEVEAIEEAAAIHQLALRIESE